MLLPKIRTEVKDRGANAILKEIESIGKGSYVTVGYHMPEARQAPDGTPVAVYAAINEFGSPSKNIPPRPTLGPVVVKRQDQFYKQTIAQVRKLYTSRGVGTSLRLILDTQGVRAVKWLKAEIKNLAEPPNRPRTLERKRRLRQGTSPLLATRTMINSVTHKVRVAAFRDRKLSRMMAKLERDLRRAR